MPVDRRRVSTWDHRSRARTSSKRRCSIPNGSSTPASISAQVRGAATVGYSRPRSEYGAVGVFGAAVLRPVEEHLAATTALGHLGDHQSRVRLLKRLGDPLRVVAHLVGATGAVEVGVQVDPLGPARDREAVETFGGQPLAD